MIKYINMDEVSGLEDKSFSYGSEANIYRCNQGVIKIYNPTVTKSMRENKEEKIHMLDNIKEAKNYFIIPHTLVNDLKKHTIDASIMDEFMGATLDEEILNFKEKLIILNKIKTYFTKITELGIDFYDIHPDNFLIKRKINDFDLKICDSGNVEIDNFKSETNLEYKALYESKMGKDKKGLYTYLINMLTYYILIPNKGYYIDHKMLEINFEKYKGYIRDKNATKIIEKMLTQQFDSEADHEYLVDVITEDNFGNKMLIK